MVIFVENLKRKHGFSVDLVWVRGHSNVAFSEKIDFISVQHEKWDGILYALTLARDEKQKSGLKNYEDTIAKCRFSCKVINSSPVRVI